MGNFRKTVALLCVIATVSLGLFGCGKETPQPTQTTPANKENRNTLVIGTMHFDGKFSPFFYTNAYESDVLELVHVTLLETDREGAVVLQGIKGETRPYNGTEYTYTGIADCEITEEEDGRVNYDITLKAGLQFSDGTAMDIDDVIFSMYVALDPAYDGSMTVYSLPIAGLQDYREGEAQRVTGIQRMSDHSMRVVMEEMSATAIYTLADIPVAPLHYYGDEDQYDYAEGSLALQREICRM